MRAYLKARIWEPSTHAGLGWCLAAIAWSDMFSVIVHGVLMIAAGGFFVGSSLLAEGGRK